jgi:hypothetical protein
MDQLNTGLLGVPFELKDPLNLHVISFDVLEAGYKSDGSDIVVTGDVSVSMCRLLVINTVFEKVFVEKIVFEERNMFDVNTVSVLKLLIVG